MRGHLDLVCDLDGRGVTRLARQSFRAPVHLSKPFWESSALVVNLASPTAGLLEGDRVRVDVEVQPGARLVLTTPAATRIHTMPGGGSAEVTQRFAVRAGGSLEFLPELLIPQRGARYFQRTTLELEPGGELLFFESLAPGRTAAGEVFEFDEIRWATDLRVGGRLAARERFRLAPGEGLALRRRFPAAYYASALVVADALGGGLLDQLHGLHADDGWVGASALNAPGAFAIKMVAADSLALRRILRAVRAGLYEALGRPAPDLRRT